MSRLCSICSSVFSPVNDNLALKWFLSPEYCRIHIETIIIWTVESHNATTDWRWNTNPDTRHHMWCIMTGLRVCMQRSLFYYFSSILFSCIFSGGDRTTAFIFSSLFFFSPFLGQHLKFILLVISWIWFKTHVYNFLLFVFIASSASFARFPYTNICGLSRVVGKSVFRVYCTGSWGNVWSCDTTTSSQNNPELSVMQKIGYKNTQITSQVNSVRAADDQVMQRSHSDGSL